MWNGQLVEVYREAKSRGLSTSLDPQKLVVPTQRSLFEVLAKILPFTELLMLDDDEAKQITQTSDIFNAMRLLRQAGAAIVAVKRGADDALIGVRDRVFERPVSFVPNDQIVESVGPAMPLTPASSSGIWPIGRWSAPHVLPRWRPLQHYAARAARKVWQRARNWKSC